MMFQLGTPEPVTKELMPAVGDRPAVKVTFNPQPSPLSLRFGRFAVAQILRAGGPDAQQQAADAFSREIVRHNMLAWSGIYRGEEELQPTPDVEHRDDEGNLIEVEHGTISGFLSEPRLMEAADREYVLPWSLLDAEKNGLSPSPNGISEGATEESDTANASAITDATDDADPTAPPLPKPAAKAARTKPKPRKPTRAKHSGS